MTSQNLDRPALLGGRPSFISKLPITQPTLPSFRDLQKDYSEIFRTGQITNGPFVRRFEEAARKVLGVKHAIAVSSCTSGLMLLLRGLGLRGKVILPSFTFCATGHAVLWSGLEPVFVDVDPNTLNLDPRAVEKACGRGVSAILGVHVFGNPAPVEALEAIAKRKKIRLFFDAAHAFGSLRGRRSVGGFGDGEVFSLSPTKLVTAGEGGLVTTNSDEVAKAVVMGRNYGHPGDYNCRFPGLSARMSEMNAVLAFESLRDLKLNVSRRNVLASLYRKELKKVPGIRFQMVMPTDQSTYKDFSILVSEKEFGLTRNRLSEALTAENIDVRPYFDPPLHQQTAFQRKTPLRWKLLATMHISHKSLSLPLYSHLKEIDLHSICNAIIRIHRFRDEISVVESSHTKKF
jgi:dTDP-4-amino-4,6-dideoxygalactose transaminase